MTSPRSLHPSSPPGSINTLVPRWWGGYEFLPQAARPCELGWPLPNEQVYLQGPVGQWTVLLLALLAYLNQTYIRWGIIPPQIWYLCVLRQSKDGWGLGVKSVTSLAVCLELWDNEVKLARSSRSALLHPRCEFLPLRWSEMALSPLWS